MNLLIEPMLEMLEALLEQTVGTEDGDKLEHGIKEVLRIHQENCEGE